MLKMKELPMSERPYEKLEMYGAGMLSNSELLGIIIKTGTKNENSVSIAQKILNLNYKKTDDLRFLQDVSIEEFMKIKGIGKIKAIQLLAVCELAKRMSRPLERLNIKIKNTKDVAKLLMEEMGYEKREKVKLILLNNKNEIIKITDISYGTSNLAIVEPKDILLEAIKLQAPKIILVHNHPSGDPTPSNNDFEVTDRIDKCSKMLGIELMDHVIIGDNTYASIFSNNLRKEYDRKCGN